MSQQEQHGDRQVFHGSWHCAQCGGAISELPFEPDNSRPLYCRDCHRERRAERAERQRQAMVQGSWTCAQCGGHIDALPFNPTRTDNLLCRTCHRAQRMAHAA